MLTPQPEVPERDLSRSESSSYACPCGTYYTVTIWRWIDVDAQPVRGELALRRGPVDGQCPDCAVQARGAATWLQLSPSSQSATLMIDKARRATVVDEVIDHLKRVKADPTGLAAWILQPSLDFTDRREEVTMPRAESDASANVVAAEPEHRPESRSQLAPLPTEATPFPDVSSLFEEIEETPSADLTQVLEAEPEAETLDPDAPLEDEEQDPDVGVPVLIGRDAAPRPRAASDDLGAIAASVTVTGGRVRVSASVSDGSLDKWEGASIAARPIHLRGRGYPLVGVRLVAKHFGQVGCIDAVIDPGEGLANDLFRGLAERFAVEVCLSGSQREVNRVVVGEDLEPNAALCIESARGALAREALPPEEFARAKASFEDESVSERLKVPTEGITAGAYPHIVGGSEALRALAHLDRVSQKESLAYLLEVDGLPMGEYDAIRRRVLEGSLEHGLCAPRRFWRRLVASGLATDLQDYATQLAANRAEHEGEEGDLDPTQAKEAWQSIRDLCDRKRLTVPESAAQALGLTSATPRERAAATAGEIRSGEISVGPSTTPPAPPSAAGTDAPLHDPTQRLRAATDILQGRAQGDVDLVLEALEEFDTDELLAIMPDLSDLGPRAVPGLLSKLGSSRREVRQAAVILLGMSMEVSALDSLANHLVLEPSTVWADVARALGGFGPSAIRVLCHVLSRQAGTPTEALAIDRVARALAEIALSDGEAAGAAAGNTAVEALAEAADPRVSAAAMQALASLGEVRASGAQIRGELPLAEVTQVRGFARRAYEAIMVPELEAEAEA